MNGNNIVIRALLLLHDEEFKKEVEFVREKYKISTKAYLYAEPDSIEEKLSINDQLLQLFSDEEIIQELTMTGDSSLVQNDNLYISAVYPAMMLARLRPALTNDILILSTRYFTMYQQTGYNLYDNAILKFLVKCIFFNMESVNINDSLLVSIVKHFHGELGLEVFKNNRKSLTFNGQEVLFPRNWILYLKALIEFQFNYKLIEEICDIFNHDQEEVLDATTMYKGLKRIAEIGGYQLRRRKKLVS